MIVCLAFTDNRGGVAHNYHIGSIELALNYDVARIGKWLESEWAVWQKEVPQPDSNSQFIDWLEQRHPSGVKRINDLMHHTF